VHVHVEDQAGRLHVWVGAPAQAGLTAAALMAALLQADPDVLRALARLVINGQDESLPDPRRSVAKETA
jgi:hypothetical protein